MKTTVFSDKYEYINKEYINKGGFGEIYRIRDQKLKTEFILKKIKKDYIFDKEINSLIDVKGTNIVNIFDWYYNQNEDCYYLILEKMDGDLKMMLLDNYESGMNSKLIRKIFLQINSGLKIMINKGITHRDLKPENILFSYTNDKKTDFIVKISDFGLSADLKSKTEMASNVGTVYFIAPEIMTENKYSNKCDLYSICTILYMLKTGEYIFDGKELVDILNNKKLNKIKKDTDDAKLNNLIKKLVVINPKERMEWKEYFDDPFFKVNDEDVKESEECKIKN